MENSIFNEMESSVASYCRSFPALFSKASGSEIWDAEGVRRLDFLAGAGALNYGHNHPALTAALVEYISKDGIAMSLDLHTEAKAAFLSTFAETAMSRCGLDHVVQFTGPTGTNAVEAAMKIARKVTGRTTIAAFTNGFHGMTLGALAATGNAAHRRGAGLPLPGGALLPYDGYLGPDVDTTAYFEALLCDPSSGFDRPAAVIVECVQGEGGLNVARASWLRNLSRICRAHGVLLIVDDIQAGCGRSGGFFSFERAGIVPDIVTLSKSLSGSGLPMSIVLIRRDLDQWEPGEHNGTFRGNNLAFVTARAALELFWRDDTFELEIARKAKRVHEALAVIAEDHPGVFAGQKGIGMMQGLLCVDAERAAAICGAAYERGLIIERAGPRDEVLKVFAPLTTPLAQLDEGLAILAEAVDVTSGQSCRNVA